MSQYHRQPTAKLIESIIVTILGDANFARENACESFGNRVL